MDRSTEIQATGSRLMRLRQKLSARVGTPGYEKNCEALRAEIARLEGLTMTPKNEEQPKPTKKPQPGKRHRSAKSGEFVTEEEAAAEPDTTVSETIKPRD